MTMKRRWLPFFPAMLALGLTAACSSSDSPSGPSGAGADIYPMYADDNRDGVNDYAEAATHDPGTPAGHAYVDANRNGICDRAQNGSPSWHGPGFVDANGDGTCDYWQSGGGGYGRPGSHGHDGSGGHGDGGMHR
jgi:hypothetical protein